MEKGKGCWKQMQEIEQEKASNFKRIEVISKVVGVTGPTGATGPAGERGEKGERGPSGLKGEKGDRGETGAKGDAGEKGEIGEKGEKGDRGEKGETGSAELISIGETETIEPDDIALVQDDFEDGVHNLTFYIPRGATGLKGEKGDRGETGAKGDTGEKGDAGEKGEKGDKGVDAVIPNKSATIFNMAGQDVTTGQPIYLMRTMTNNELTTKENSITIENDGTYFIAYYINRAEGAAGTDSISLAFNGVINSNTARPLSESSTSSGQFVMNLSKGTEITLVPVVMNAKKLIANGGPSATLTVFQIA